MGAPCALLAVQGTWSLHSPSCWAACPHGTHTRQLRYTRTDRPTSGAHPPVRCKLLVQAAQRRPVPGEPLAVSCARCAPKPWQHPAALALTRTRCRRWRPRPPLCSQTRPARGPGPRYTARSAACGPCALAGAQSPHAAGGPRSARPRTRAWERGGRGRLWAGLAGVAEGQGGHQSCVCAGAHVCARM